MIHKLHRNHICINGIKFFFKCNQKKIKSDFEYSFGWFSTHFHLCEECVQIHTKQSNNKEEEEKQIRTKKLSISILYHFLSRLMAFGYGLFTAPTISHMPFSICVSTTITSSNLLFFFNGAAAGRAVSLLMFVDWVSGSVSRRISFLIFYYVLLYLFSRPHNKWMTINKEPVFI